MIHVFNGSPDDPTVTVSGPQQNETKTLKHVNIPV